MKKVLLATTAFAALGFASATYAQEAPISFSGSAEFGFGGEYGDGNPDEEDFLSDVELDVAFTGSADFGISFSASAEIDADGLTNGGDAEFSGFSIVFSQESFGTFSFGDTDGAFDSALQSVDSAGLNDSADFYLSGDSGLDGTGDDGDRVFNWDFDFGLAAFHASFEENDGSEPFEDDVDSDDSPIFGFGLDGDFAGWNFGIAYQFGEEDDEGTDAFGVSAAGALGPIDAKFLYTFVDTTGEDAASNFDVSLVYNFDPFQFGGNFTFQEENDDVGDDAVGYGFWTNYDLGGGLNFTAAAGTIDGDTGNQSQFDFGFSLSF